jgi:hypothetical protein
MKPDASPTAETLLALELIRGKPGQRALAGPAGLVR